MVPLKLYTPGDVIVGENASNEKAYVIEQGKVEITQAQNGSAVHIAYLEAGQTFGEMGLITDKPQNVTVTVVEPTWVREIHRNDFFDALRTEPDTALMILQSLFSHLHDLEELGTELITPLRPAEFHTLSQPSASSPRAPATTLTTVMLEGLTRAAAQALPTSPLHITTFPFNIGRQHADALNDLSLPDSRPWQISKHHVSLVKHDNRIGVQDRGSRLGSLVDGQPLGGKQGALEPIFFSDTVGELVLGNMNSPFYYRVTITTQP